MILAIVSYGLIVSALASLAAWLAERALIAYKRPRRHAWIGGIAVALLVPVLALIFREPDEVALTSMLAIVQNPVQSAALSTVAPAASPGGEASDVLNTWLAALWALTSGVLIALLVSSAWRLGRRARTWRSVHIDSHPVVVSPDLGPAVFGWFRSRVVFPHWLIAAPAPVQRMALAHERAHVDALDAQVLGSMTLLAALLPWNLPLLWMLRRMRFAMEVDCDARVIRRGADPNDYGLALLYVSERQSRAPITAIALIERKSQLEQRIHFMFTATSRYPALVAGLCMALAAFCVAAAGQLQAPNLTDTPVILKPPPDKDSTGFRLGQQFERHLSENYPELMGGQFEGMPIVVVLLNDDWSIAKSARVENRKAGDRFPVTRELFGVLGLAPQDVPYSGAMNMQMSPGKVVLMAYTERTRPGEEFVSKAFPDTRKLDRELFAQEFPEATSGVISDADHWLLLDRSGAVLRKGVEPNSSSRELNQRLEQRFPGIDTQEVTVTLVTDDSGRPLLNAAGKKLNLWSVWLAPGSPVPTD